MIFAKILAYLVFGALMMFVLNKDPEVKDLLREKRTMALAVLVWPLAVIVYLLAKTVVVIGKMRK